MTVHSIEAHRLFIEQCGWSHQRCRDGMLDARCDLLLAPDTSR